MNRRALLKSLAGAVGASVVPAPIAKPMTLGVDMAKDNAFDAMLYYVMVQNPKTGVVGMYSYKATLSGKLTVEKVITPKA